MSFVSLDDLIQGASEISSFSNAPSRGLIEEHVSDPYISGYFYVLFTKVPEFVDPNVLQVFRVQQKAVTLPDITVNTTEIVTGFGGAGKEVHVTSVDKGTDFNIKLLEQTGLPVINALANWVENMRDYNSGLSSLKNYSLSQYSGEVLVVLTKPILDGVKDEQAGSFIEKAFYLTKVFPTSVPFSSLNQDITASDKVEIDVPFKHSGFYHGEAVNKFAASKLTQLNANSMLDIANGLFS